MHDVAEDFPIVAERDRRAQAAAHFGAAVRKGAPYEHPQRDFRNIQVAFERSLATLKRDHNVHHDEHVTGDAKLLRPAFDRLLAQMAGRSD